MTTQAMSFKAHDMRQQYRWQVWITGQRPKRCSAGCLRRLSTGHDDIYYSYDAAGRQRFMVDATGAVTETKYDAAGHVVETVQYANTVDPKNRAVRVAYTPNTNSSVHRNLGSFKAGDRVIAEVWFKDVDTSGMIFLGDTWGATPYSNAIYLTEYGRETGKS
jgi:hypothetical protein